MLNIKLLSFIEGCDHMNQTRLMKSARNIDLFLKMIQILLTVGGGLLLLIGLARLLGAESWFPITTTELSVGLVKLTLSDHAWLDSGVVKGSLMFHLLLALIPLIMAWYGIKLIRVILQPMKDGRPFEEGISNKLKTLGWVLLIGGAILEGMKLVGGSLLLHAYEFESFLNADRISGYQINYAINGSFLFLACVLFLLSYIFRYGEELQRESDETL